MRILQKCLIHKSTSATLRIPFGIRITPQFGLPNWVYPTLKMTTFAKAMLSFSWWGKRISAWALVGDNPQHPLEAFRRLSKNSQHCDHSHESQSYPDKMAFRQSVVLFSEFFSLSRAPSCRYITANVSSLEHDQAELGFLALIYKKLETYVIIEKRLIYHVFRF